MEQFCFNRPKANYDAAFVEIDVTAWLGDEVLTAVTFSALDSEGANATAEVLDLTESTFADGIIMPYIKGGIDLERYTVICQADTVNGSHQEFRIVFNIREAP